MRIMPVRELVPSVSRGRRRTRAPAVFAVSSSGEVFLNLLVFDGVHSIQDALDRALLDTDVFVGVHVSPREARQVMSHLEAMLTEPAARLAATRQRRRRRQR